MELKFQSRKRPIIEAVLNGKKIMLLVDTGASVGMIDKRVKGLHPSHRTIPIVDASGDEIRCDVLNDFVNVGGKEIAQFITSDLSGIRESIRRETGIDIQGILSYPQVQMLGASVDTEKNVLVAR